MSQEARAAPRSALSELVAPRPTRVPRVLDESAPPGAPGPRPLRRIAFSSSPAPPSPARGPSSSPSVPAGGLHAPLSSSYLALARGSYTPQSSLQGAGVARRRASVYRSYRQPRAGEPALVVFSGGSGFNSAAEEMGKRLTTRVTHVLPVSDDGGSTAEIVRVLGGPAVGDIRSRCLRLSDDSTDEGQAVKALLGHRLHPSNAAAAKHEWAEIVDGTHALWKGIGTPYRDTIRAFLLHFNYEILREPTTLFNFCNGSVGNFFFAGARTFFKSMDAAIFLYGRVSHIPPQSLVTPAVATADRLTLGAELVDGTIIRGQNAISHPPPAPGALGTTSPQAYASPAASSSNLVVRKDSQTFLHSRIKRVFYASSDISSADPTKPYEIYPPVHSAVPGNIYEADGIIYAMGSFFTSICPSLVLKGVGEAIARRRCRKILVLNGCIDRETHGMDRATDYVRAVTDHLNRVHSLDPEYRLDNPPSSYVNCIFVPRGSDAIEVDELELRRMGIKKIVQVETVRPAGSLVFSKERSGGEEGEGARRGSAAQSSKSSLDPAYAAAGGDAAKPQVLYDTADLIRMLKWALTTHRRPATGDNGAAPAANGGEEPSEEGSDEGWVSSSDEDEPEATDAVVGVTLGAGLQVAGGPG